MRENKKRLRISLLITVILIFIQGCTSETKKVTQPLSIIDTSYPKHTCNKKPLKPKKPGEALSYKNIETYNLKISKFNLSVEKYNKEIHIYKKCINKYINKGNKDINNIRLQLNNALKEARMR